MLHARRAGLLSASGLATYFFCLWITTPWLGFALGEVSPIFFGLIALNVVLAVFAPAWGTRRYVGAIYGTTHALVMTLVLHELGGLVVGFLLFVQLFPIFHAAMLGSTGEVFVTANVTGASFALLALAEATGALPMRGPLVWQVTPAQAIAAGAPGNDCDHRERSGRHRLRGRTRRPTRETIEPDRGGAGRGRLGSMATSSALGAIAPPTVTGGSQCRTLSTALRFRYEAMRSGNSSRTAVVSERRATQSASISSGMRRYAPR